MNLNKLFSIFLLCISLNVFTADKQSYKPLISELLSAIQAGPDNSPSVTRAKEIITLFAAKSVSLEKQYNGSTLLGLAALHGNYSVVECLCENGAIINARMRSDSTALHQAASIGCYTTVTTLLRHQANPALLTTAEQTPLHRALISIASDVAIALIDAGSPLDIADNFGNTPLSLALEKDMTVVVAYIQYKQRT